MWLGLFTPVVSIWWKNYKVVVYCTSIPNSLFKDFTVMTSNQWWWLPGKWATNQAFKKNVFILDSLLSNIHWHTTDKILFLWNSRIRETNTWLLKVRKESVPGGEVSCLGWGMWEMYMVMINVLYFVHGGGSTGVNILICLHFTICRWYLS